MCEGASQYDSYSVHSHAFRSVSIKSHECEPSICRAYGNTRLDGPLSGTEVILSMLSSVQLRNPVEVSTTSVSDYKWHNAVCTLYSVAT